MLQHPGQRHGSPGGLGGPGWGCSLALGICWECQGGIWVVAAPEGLRLFPEDGGAVLEGLGWAVLEELWLPIVKVRVSPEV